MKKYLFSIALASLLISCGDTGKKNQPEIKTVDTKPEIHQPAELHATFKDSLIGEVYKKYNAVKSGLVNSDAKKTQKAAKQLTKSIEQVEFSERIKKTAHKIASTSVLETQRANFQYLTEEMAKLVKNNLSSGKLYLQYCPMAFQGKGGYWLSNGKEIRNPYYGDRMLQCGEVHKVIE